MEKQSYWNEAYRAKGPNAVSWFQLTPEASLAALDRLKLEGSASLIDVGGGASNLVDALVQRKWSDLTVLDISDAGLEAANDRLGQDANRVQWIVADATTWAPARTYDVWHDRAVFHFLTEEGQRLAYRRALDAATTSGSHVVIATFALDGPPRCSGLPVQRYDEQSLSKALGPRFRLRHNWREEHHTPSGTSQMFNWCIFEKV